MASTFGSVREVVISSSSKSGSTISPSMVRSCITKNKYTTEYMANTVILSIRRKDKNKNLRSYFCKECKNYHITSKSLESKYLYK